MNHDQRELPDGWQWLPLSEVATFKRGISFPATAKRDSPVDGTIVCLRTANVQEQVDWDDLLYVSKDYVHDPDKYLRDHDILISMANSLELVGKVAYVDKPRFASTFGGFISAVRAKEKVSPQYLYHVLRSTQVQGQFRNTASRSVNIANLSLGAIYPIALPIAPLADQKRIVERIESLFAQSRTAREALEHVPALLKQFRQAVLAAAFRGELTERDPNDEPAAVLLERIREQRRQKRKFAEPEFRTEIASLRPPAGWYRSPLEACADLITKGESPKWQGYEYVGEGVPFIRSENVLWGKLDYSAAVRIPLEFHEKLKRSQLRPRDVLINLVGASIGRSAVVPQLIEVANINQAVATVRTNEALTPEYLMYFVISPNTQHVLQGKKVDVARANISLGDLRQLSIPLAPVNEQHRIIARIEVLFTQADAIEYAVEVARRRAEKLDQAILARAFRGELLSL